MKIQKGDAGYLRRRKRLLILEAVVSFGLVAALVIAGYVTTKVYFRSKNPPKLTQNNDKNYCYLPIFRDVYVPKASLKKYKKWYKKNDALQFVKLKTF